MNYSGPEQAPWEEFRAFPPYFAAGVHLPQAAGSRPETNKTLKTFIMEQINRVEIIGRVGTASFNKVGEKGTPLLRFSVATDYVYKDREGTPVIDTTWHNVSCWGDRTGVAAEDIVRGCAVRVIGRIRQDRYTNAEGMERTTYEIQASSVEILDEQVTAQCSF